MEINEQQALATIVDQALQVAELRDTIRNLRAQVGRLEAMVVELTPQTSPPDPDATEAVAARDGATAAEPVP